MILIEDLPDCLAAFAEQSHRREAVGESGVNRDANL